MSWSGLDYLVVALFAAQALALVGVALVLLRLKASAQSSALRVGRVVKAGVSVAETAQTVGPALAQRAGAVARSAASLRDKAQFPEPPAGFLLTPQGIQKGFLTYRTVRSLAAAARERKLPKRRPTRTLADRMGLVPPIVRKLDWLWHGGRAAFRTYRASRGGGTGRN